VQCGLPENQFKDLHSSLGQSAGLLDAIQKQFHKAARVHFLLPPESHAADTFEFARGVVHDDSGLAARHFKPPLARRQTV
jgi:hypothetical protein